MAEAAGAEESAQNGEVAGKGRGQKKDGKKVYRVKGAETPAGDAPEEETKEPSGENGEAPKKRRRERKPKAEAVAGGGEGETPAEGEAREKNPRERRAKKEGGRGENAEGQEESKEPAEGKSNREGNKKKAVDRSSQPT